MALPAASVVHQWTTEDVLDWLSQANLEQCVDAFRKRDIDGTKFLTLTDESFLLWAGELKISQRKQITRYLNECRNRDPNNQGITSALKLKRKSAAEPPPVPKPDYTGSMADDDSYDEGWDTDFDDDSEDDEEERHNETKHRHSSEDLASNSRDENGSSTPFVGKQIAEIIRKFNLEPPPITHSNNFKLPDNSTHTGSPDGQAWHENRSDNPKKKALPRPPNLPVVGLLLRNNNNGRTINADGGPRHSVVRPQQQPPPPPTSSSQPIQTSSACSTPTLTVNIHQDLDQSLENVSFGDAYEVPTPSYSENGSMDLQVATSLNSLSISGDSSSIHGNQDLLSQSQQELCQDLVMDKDYEMPDESQWSGSSGVSSSSDRPALPPKMCSPDVVPPPLPQKPLRRAQANGKAPLPRPVNDDNKPPLPSRKSSEDNVGKVRNRPSLDGCKQAITTLFSNLGNRLSSDKRADSTTGVDKVSSPDREMLPTLAAATEMTKSYSMTSLRYGLTDSASCRPLPPVPNPTTNQTRNSQEVPLPNLQSSHSLESQPWFHKVERDAAAATLKQLGHSGSYLVRESRRAGESNPYSLTVFYDNKVSHLNIRKRTDTTFALGKEKDNEKTFPTVEELITYHQREPILLTARGQQIGKTCLVMHPDKH